MPESRITHFFDVIKKEVIAKSQATLSTNNDETDFTVNIKQEHIIKEEIDIPWFEANCIVKKEQDDLFSRKPINFNARVVIDKLPDSIFQKHLKSEINIIENHENSTEDIVADNCSAISPGNLQNTDSRNGADSDNDLESDFYWKICKTCNVKNRTSTRSRCASKCHNCKTLLIFQCENCHKQVANVQAMKRHLNFKCGLKRKYHYYKCFECDFQKPYLSSTRRHVQRMHPTMTSQMHRIETIKSDDIKNDLLAKRKELKCLKCEKIFEYIPILMRHVQICTGNKGAIVDKGQSTVTDFRELRSKIGNRILYYCQRCDKDVMYNKIPKSFGNRLSVKKCPDCKTFTIFKCLECKKQYISKVGLSFHIKSTHLDERQYKCSTCDYKSPLLHSLCKHYRRMHMLATHECSNCGQNFDKDYKLSRHLKQCGIQPQYNCDHCSFKTHFRNVLGNHMLRCHITGNEIECPTCKKTLKHLMCLKTHQKTCGNRSKIKCAHCSYRTHNKYYLTRHSLTCHSIHKEIECPICKKVQKSEESLKNHLKLCKLDYSHCKLCSFKTKNIWNLNLHMQRTHSKAKNICSIIGELRKRGNFTLKEYRCDHCSYKSHVRYDVYKHIVKKHLNEKNTKCSKCGDKFQNSVYLQAHLKYCGLKPYLHCENCSFKTYLKGHLTQHVKRHRNT